jgi:hypothetical protein
VQRLFSTFPNSWPGAGLLILRLAAGLSLVGVGTMMGDLGDTAAIFLRCASLVVAVLLFIGLATPVAGIVRFWDRPSIPESRKNRTSSPSMTFNRTGSGLIRASGTPLASGLDLPWALESRQKKNSARRERAPISRPM